MHYKNNSRKIENNVDDDCFPIFKILKQHYPNNKITVGDVNQKNDLPHYEFYIWNGNPEIPEVSIEYNITKRKMFIESNSEKGLENLIEEMEKRGIKTKIEIKPDATQYEMYIKPILELEEKPQENYTSKILKFFKFEFH